VIRFLLALIPCLPVAAYASPWDFGDPITVAGTTGKPHFHHLDGAGRQHVAATSAEVALVWEDDHTGAPQVYVAVKANDSDSFSRASRLSEGEEAYEPAIVSIGGQRWLAAWEQDGAIAARVVDREGLGPLTVLSPNVSRQVTLASDGSSRVAGVWARERSGGQVLEAAELRIEAGQVRFAGNAVPVAPVSDHPFQGYPAAAWGSGGHLIVAWEDRRAGHTRLFHTSRLSGSAFSAERQLNEHFAPREAEREVVGLGSGVMRVDLAANAAGHIRAVWLDKRNPWAGYAVWGAASADGGETFGPNRIVQDELGSGVQQWHASIAGGKPGFVAVWDDTREIWSDPEESGDVLLSWAGDGDWSANLLVPGASGKGYQGSPAIGLDPNGDLHLIWIERENLASPSRLLYLHGKLRGP